MSEAPQMETSKPGSLRADVMCFSDESNVSTAEERALGLPAGIEPLMIGDN